MAEMAVALRQQRGIAITTLKELVEFSQMVVRAGWAPRGTTPEQAVIAMQMGMELGLSPMQALQNISVVNGRPAIWGDAMPGLIYASGLMVDYREEKTRPTKDEYVVKVFVQRRGQKPISRDYSISKAKRAGLWGKQGSWTTNPDRMIMIRARTFAFRDAFPDVLKGLTSVEEALDAPTELQEVEVVEPQTKQLPSLDDFFSVQPIATEEVPDSQEVPAEAAEVETGEEPAPRPRRPYTRRTKPAEAAPVSPKPPAPTDPKPISAILPTMPVLQQEPPRPLTKYEELFNKCNDLAANLRQMGIGAKLPLGVEDYSYDDLVALEKQLKDKFPQ